MKTFALTTTILVSLTSIAAAQDATRALIKVEGDVYRWQNNNHFGLVVFTDAGVVVADPINAEASSWLEREIATNTDLPVTQLIYSHSHGDHASGGEVFNNTAETIANKKAPNDASVPRHVGDVDSMTVGNKTFEFTYLGAGHGADLMAVIVRPENVAFVVDAMAPRLAVSDDE